LQNADLRDVDLSGTEQSQINLSRINLTGANLTGVKLNYTNLTGAYLDGDLTHTTFTGAHLSGAFLWKANLRRVDLSSADLRGADLSDANLCGSRLGQIDSETRLSGTMMPDCSHQNPVDSTSCPNRNSNIGFDSSQWHNSFYNTNGYKALANVSESDVTEPNMSGNALQISLLGGTQYTGFQAYRTLPPNNTAHTFELCLSFYITDVTPIQALAFSIQQWANNKEWEWALQWQNISDGTPQQGTPPNWRIWTGNGKWHDTQLPQQVSAGHWYQLDLVGNVVNGQVQYGNSTFDNASLNLGQNQFDPVSPLTNSGDELVVSVELNGNSQEDSYDVYVDNINFIYN
jgi:uncharacterized protein YjbI with pentapeptide repeats